MLLLNRVLTVEPGRPASHRGKGWEPITEAAIRALVARGGPLVAVLWGKDAQTLQPLLGRHPVIASAHPSPMSADRGFFGSEAVLPGERAAGRAGRRTGRLGVVTGGVRRARGRLTAALFAGGIATFAELYAVQAVLPAIAEEWQLTESTVSLAVSVATGALALSVLPWAAVADRIVIALARPIRSATAAQGSTDRANAPVATDTASDTVDSVSSHSAATAGSTAWTA